MIYLQVVYIVCYGKHLTGCILKHDCLLAYIVSLQICLIETKKVKVWPYTIFEEYYVIILWRATVFLCHWCGITLGEGFVYSISFLSVGSVDMNIIENTLFRRCLKILASGIRNDITQVVLVQFSFSRSIRLYSRRCAYCLVFKKMSYGITSICNQEDWWHCKQSMGIMWYMRDSTDDGIGACTKHDRGSYMQVKFTAL